MRFSMRGSLINPYNNNFSSTFTPHMTNGTCSLTQQQVSFGTHQQHEYPQQYVSIKSREPFTRDPGLRPTFSTGRLGKRWMEYQGACDWAGLLDPIDEKLRAEILRYGSLVDATYTAFDFDPASPAYGSCKYPKRLLLGEVGYPATGYRITKNLIATSGIQLPGWAGSSGPAALQSAWIGYVAVCHDRAVIARLGRRDIVVALRGTGTYFEWLENLRATLASVVPAPPSDLQNNADPMVESGFLSLYCSRSATNPSLQEAIRKEVGRILRVYPNETLSLTFTGHSLGAALATLAAYDIKTTFAGRAPHTTVISFAGPRVGNQSFRSLLEGQGTKILRLVNPSDVITKMPGFVIENNDNDYDNNNNKERREPGTNTWRRWIEKRVEEAQYWVYAEIGCELRLQESSKENNKVVVEPNINLAECHDLKTYMRLVQTLPL